MALKVFGTPIWPIPRRDTILWGLSFPNFLASAMAVASTSFEVAAPGAISAGGLAAIGVAQVRRDAAVLSLELLDRVKGRALGEEGDGRVQSPAGDEQQREAGTGLF